MKSKEKIEEKIEELSEIQKRHIMISSNFNNNKDFENMMYHEYGKIQSLKWVLSKEDED